MLARALSVALAVGLLASSAGIPNGNNGVHYHGTMKQAGVAYTGHADMKFELVDGVTIVWSNDDVDPATGQPSRAVSVLVRVGAFDVVLGDPPMKPLSSDVLSAHPQAALRVWARTGRDPFEELTEGAGATPIGEIPPSGNGGPEGVPSAVWSLKGNRGTNPPNDYLGTSDRQPLVFKTNGEPAMRVLADGTLEALKDVHVFGNEAIDHELRVSGRLTA